MSIYLLLYVPKHDVLPHCKEYTLGGGVHLKSVLLSTRHEFYNKNDCTKISMFKYQREDEDSDGGLFRGAAKHDVGSISVPSVFEKQSCREAVGTFFVANIFLVGP